MTEFSVFVQLILYIIYKGHVFMKYHNMTFMAAELRVTLLYSTLLTPVGLDESFTCQKERGTRLSGGKS